MNNFARSEHIFLHLDAHWDLEKANEIALQMGVDLSSLYGWQQHFQHHHNIMSLHLKSEASTKTLFAADHLENGRTNLNRHSHRSTCVHRSKAHSDRKMSWIKINIYGEMDHQISFVTVLRGARN